MKTDILLTTLNSTYQHSSFGLRYLFANLGQLQSRASILEFTTARAPLDVAERLLELNPRIIGISVYIWNATESLELVSHIKKIKPETIVVLGGPEVSYESDGQQICQLADYVIKGEADFLFRRFCEDILVEDTLPGQKFISGPLPDIKLIQSPYSYYSEEDIQNRVIYVEVSRGCPYRCEYCLSSLDKLVRNFDLDQFLSDMTMLLEKGVRQFKFIDRTFNLSPSTCTRILEFFLAKMDLGLFLHFEMVPDRLPTEIRELIKKFPAGSLQFEIGIQTWNPDVAKNVSRRNDYEKVRENFRFLREETGVHTHADLIVGLPGEDLESFAKGFDTLAELAPDEIQVGILKRLKGTPIVRHDQAWEMVYSDHPPFQILRNKSLDFQQLQKMNRFSKYWDLYANSGNFKGFIANLKESCGEHPKSSFFFSFYDFSEFLSERFLTTHSHSLVSLFQAALDFMTERLQFPLADAQELLAADFSSSGKRDLPRFLKATDTNMPTSTVGVRKGNSLNKRQQRHLT